MHSINVALNRGISNITLGSRAAVARNKFSRMVPISCAASKVNGNSSNIAVVRDLQNPRDIDISLKKIGELKNSLNSAGFTRFDISLDCQKELNLLRCELDNLEVDKHDPASNRQRAYSSGIILPWSGDFFPIPSSKTVAGEKSFYYQGNFNPEYANKPREFNSISNELINSNLLKNLVATDYSLTEWSTHEHNMPLYVGIHLVKLSVDEDHHESIASPNHLHQDGEKYTFAHLIDRINVIGGENFISNVQNAGKLPSQLGKSELMAEFVIDKPLQSYGVCDPLVSHHVNGVKLGDKGPTGFRSVVLIDFCSTSKNI